MSIWSQADWEREQTEVETAFWDNRALHNGDMYPRESAKGFGARLGRAGVAFVRALAAEEGGAIEEVQARQHVAVTTKQILRGIRIVGELGPRADTPYHSAVVVSSPEGDRALDFSCHGVRSRQVGAVIAPFIVHNHRGDVDVLQRGTVDLVMRELLTRAEDAADPKFDAWGQSAVRPGTIDGAEITFA